MLKDSERHQTVDAGTEEQGGLSRRLFLSGSGAAAAATALTSTAAQSAEEAAETAVAFAGPGPVSITLTINAKKQQLEVEPRVTLLDALRNSLDITGAKKVCDRGTCGACTVLVDGQPAYACSILAIDAQGKEIRTVESYAEDHPVVQAFSDHDASQCGFCTPGFVVACASFLQHNPNPTAEDVETGLGGNLCRCGTYDGIKSAVLQAANARKGGAR